jgi:hypothetical protein
VSRGEETALSRLAKQMAEKDAAEEAQPELEPEPEPEERAPEIAAADIPVAAMEVKWEVIYVSDNPRQTSKSSIYFGWR